MNEAGLVVVIVGILAGSWALARWADKTVREAEEQNRRIYDELIAYGRFTAAIARIKQGKVQGGERH
jgi:hypothetical protein